MKLKSGYRIRDTWVLPVEWGSMARHNAAWTPQWRRRGNSSALHEKSCHPSVFSMLEKRDGCCHTGQRRDRTCQMLHTIDAINAACCRSLTLRLLFACIRLRQLRAVSSQLAAERWILNRLRTQIAHQQTVHPQTSDACASRLRHF